MKCVPSLGVLLAAVLLAACSDSAATTTASPATTSPVTTTSSEDPVPGITGIAPPPTSAVIRSPRIPAGLDGFEIDMVELDGRELLVAVADTPATRRQGLMGVADLLDLDGMLFVFGEETTSGFWMKDTLLPLDIAFFSVGGDYVDGFEMEPCATTNCPTYFPNGSYRYALEMAAGTMPNDPRELALSTVPLGDEEG